MSSCARFHGTLEGKMTSTRRRASLETDLQLLEESFKQRLVVALGDCAAGVGKVFGTNGAALKGHFGSNADRYSE
jgi:hypothetical protein